MSLSMSHKVTFIVKGVPADLAAVRRCQTWFPASAPHRGLLVGLVCPGMSPQISCLCESPPADFAAKRRLSVVGLHVSLQRASEAELFVTHSAREWLLCRVDSHVRHHVSLLVEAFSTDVAAEGFLSSVQPLVRLLSSYRGELLPADVTGPASVTVALKVQLQTIARLQVLTTETTKTPSLL